MAVRSLVVDAGFLVALWNPKDEHHKWASATAQVYPPPWITCEAVFTEVDHLLSPVGRSTLREAVRRGAIRLVASLTEETPAVFALLDKYVDVPMSVADACLVRLTEVLPDAIVLTIDSDFRIYRRLGRRTVSCIMP